MSAFASEIGNAVIIIIIDIILTSTIIITIIGILSIIRNIGLMSIIGILSIIIVISITIYLFSSSHPHPRAPMRPPRGAPGPMAKARLHV